MKALSALGRARLIAAVQLLLASLLLIGVWGLLPARWWPIDTAGTLLAVLQLGAAIGLIAGKRWGVRLGLVAGWVTLVAGATLVTVLALTVAHLSGLYGPVGAGGAVLMAVVAALVLPYLVLLPVLQIAWLRAQG